MLPDCKGSARVGIAADIANKILRESGEEPGEVVPVNLRPIGKDAEEEALTRRHHLDNGGAPLWRHLQEDAPVVAPALPLCEPSIGQMPEGTAHRGDVDAGERCEFRDGEWALIVEPAKGSQRRPGEMPASRRRRSSVPGSCACRASTSQARWRLAMGESVGGK